MNKSPQKFQASGPSEPRASASGRDPRSTLMYREAAEAGAAVRTQFARNGSEALRLGAALRALAPQAVVTCARGSSNHAATFAKYLIETRVGVLTASAAPSVASLYGARQALDRCLFLLVSQSGRSPDLISAAEAAKKAGATVVALVNEEEAPLMQWADFALPLCAGAEHSVAATKSYIASLAAVIHLVAAWAGDEALLVELQAAADKLERAWLLDWEGAIAPLLAANHLYVIGRGLGLGIAQEAALKCKETCGLHAEAFSSAELRHGPQALLQPGFPALLFAQNDEARSGIEALATELVERGIAVLLAGAAVKGATVLPSIEAYAAIEPLLLVQSFYRLANALAIARGRDPDNPPHLRKATETL